MPDHRQTAQAHASTLLDVVFGVVIADPIAKLPKLAVQAAALEMTDLANFALTLAAIIFCSFYWLESKGFLEDSAGLFGRRNQPEYFADRGVAGQLRFDLVGGLYLVIMASAVITFSHLTELPRLLVFSIVFWLGDLLGTLDLTRRYEEFRPVILSGAAEDQAAARWWAGHVGSAFFVWYGILNVCFYLLLFALWRIFDRSPTVDVLISAAVFCFCTFRHFVWRSTIYCAVRDRWLEAASRKMPKDSDKR